MRTSEILRNDVIIFSANFVHPYNNSLWVRGELEDTLEADVYIFGVFRGGLFHYVEDIL